MLWWRLEDFLKLWAHFFASGDSRWSWVRKVIGALVFLGILRFTAWDISVLIAIQASPPLINVRLGLLIFIIVAVAWALLSAGRAYELAGVPDLRVATELEFDQSLGVFRLRLLSQQKDMETVVRVIDVFRADGKQYIHGRFPLPLDWSHKSGESRVHLTAGFEETVSVARVFSQVFGAATLFVTGATHAAEIEMSVGDSAYFQLSVEYNKRKPIERWVRFDRTSATEYRALPDNPPA